MIKAKTIDESVEEIKDVKTSYEKLLKFYMKNYQYLPSLRNVKDNLIVLSGDNFKTESAENNYIITIIEKILRIEEDNNPKKYLTVNPQKNTITLETWSESYHNGNPYDEKVYSQVINKNPQIEKLLKKFLFNENLQILKKMEEIQKQKEEEERLNKKLIEIVDSEFEMN